MSLWNFKHPYYCSAANYYNNNCNFNYNNFNDFLEEWGDADTSLSLLVRWDWDIERRCLSMYFVIQRKGYLTSVEINNVVRDDEQKVKAFLEPRWKELQEVWAGIS